MRVYGKAILLVALFAADCVFASDEGNASKNSEPAAQVKSDRDRYKHFDARIQPIPEDPSVAKAMEIEPLIRGLDVQLKPGVEAPDFDLPVLLVEENDEGEKIGVVGNDTVRLSSFRGKKAVALTLSGST
jgi:hypothetical protein